MTKLIKYTMFEKGLVDDKTQVLNCPGCDCSGLFDPVKEEVITPLIHDTPCLFVNACRDIGVDPYDLKDERVMRVITVKPLF